MAKQGMAQLDWTPPKPQNAAPPVQGIQGKAKRGKEAENLIISGTGGPELKGYHKLKDNGPVREQHRK